MLARDMLRSLLLCLLFTGSAAAAFGNSCVPPPFTLKPYNATGIGPSAANYEGCFRQNGGPPQFREFIGTGGSLVLTFSQPFTNGPGNDFAILTSSQAWGAPTNNSALFQFFLGSILEDSFTATLAPDQLFQFDLPGNSFKANRVLVTNLTSGDMTFDDAGASHPFSRTTTPEPGSFILLATGLIGLVGLGRRKLFR